MVAENIHVAVKSLRDDLTNIQRQTLIDLEKTVPENERQYLKGKSNLCKIVLFKLERMGY